jgi:putative phosphoribosyl transferase
VLANSLEQYRGAADLQVLGLPRGGVPVAYEVARGLSAPLDVWLVRKLGVPGHEELAMGAVASGDVLLLNDDVVAQLGIRPDEIERVASAERHELVRRGRAYRGDRPPLRLDGRTVIVVDDGLATGATMRAAVAAIGQHHPERVVVACPVGAAATCRALAADRNVDDLVCLVPARVFHAVGLWYEDFSPTTDEEVRRLLAEPAEPSGAPDPAS